MNSDFTWVFQEFITVMLWVLWVFLSCLRVSNLGTNFWTIQNVQYWSKSIFHWVSKSWLMSYPKLPQVVTWILNFSRVYSASNSGYNSAKCDSYFIVFYPQLLNTDHEQCSPLPVAVVPSDWWKFDRNVDKKWNPMGLLMVSVTFLIKLLLIISYVIA